MSKTVWKFAGDLKIVPDVDPPGETPPSEVVGVIDTGRFARGAAVTR
jgi:hypothetical protein